MSTISDDPDSIQSFIEEKNRFDDEGWKFLYIFESRFIPDNCKTYGSMMKSLEEKIHVPNQILCAKMSHFLKHNCAKKRFDKEVRAVKIIHPATKSGFCGGKLSLEDEFEKNYTKEDPEKFIDHFRKIVGDKNIVPDNTVIILSKESHHLVTPKPSPQSRKRSLDDASKNPSTSAPANTLSSSSVQDNELQVEKITRLLRGDSVKILWIPKENYEVDPCQYLSIFLNNEIANNCNAAADDTDLKDVVKETIELFPNEMWKDVVEIAARFEDSHFEDDEEEEEED